MVNARRLLVRLAPASAEPAACAAPDYAETLRLPKTRPLPKLKDRTRRNA
jgi:hypothetical protein